MDHGSPAAILRRHGLRPKKSWGQCFLHDPRVVQAIVELVARQQPGRVIEIGAGLGVLTRPLAACVAEVIAIERDRDLARVLRDELHDLPNVRIVEDNALLYDFERHAPTSVVGNLPYNISSPLLFRLLEQRAGWHSATLMLQRELATRIAAPPGSRTYGAPSVICQRHADVRLCLQVGRGAFTPVPAVDSAVIQLQIRGGAPAPAAFDAVVHAAFAQRRKTLRRALAARFSAAAVAAALERCGIDGQRRAEQLAVGDYDALAAALTGALP